MLLLWLIIFSIFWWFIWLNNFILQTKLILFWTIHKDKSFQGNYNDHEIKWTMFLNVIITWLFRLKKMNYNTDPLKYKKLKSISKWITTENFVKTFIIYTTQGQSLTKSQINGHIIAVSVLFFPLRFHMYKVVGFINMNSKNEQTHTHIHR